MPRSPQDRDTDHLMTDAIEHGLWQSLADALRALEDWGLTPLGAIREIDAGPVIHGAGVRPPGGYLLRYQPAFTPDPDRPGHDLPSGWQVTVRPAAPTR